MDKQASAGKISGKEKEEEKEDCNCIRGKTVLELGAGLGLCGLAAAYLGAIEVILTDLDYILETLRSNVALNKLSIDSCSSSSIIDSNSSSDNIGGLSDIRSSITYHNQSDQGCTTSTMKVLALNWFHPERSEVRWSLVDTIVASDTIWLEPLVAPFVNTLVYAAKQNPKVVVFISNQLRSQMVWDKFTRLIAGTFALEVVEKDYSNIEIWKLTVI